MATYQQQLESIGFRFDTATYNGYNKINGICFTVNIDANNKDYIVSAACRPQQEEAVDSMRQAIAHFAGERTKIIKTAAFNGKEIMIIWHLGDLLPDITKCVRESVDFISYCISQFGCVSCCASCGRENYCDIYVIENHITALCQDCFVNTQNTMAGNMYREKQIKTNYPLGVLGAVLGGLAGAVIWILFSMMGKIAIVAGGLAGMGGYFGFKVLGKKMTFKGLVISLVVSLVFLVGGMYVAMGIDMFNAFKEYGVGFSEAFELIPYYLSDPDSTGEIIYNHIFGFLTFILGAVCCVAQYFQEKKVKNRMIKLM